VARWAPALAIGAVVAVTTLAVGGCSSGGHHVVVPVPSTTVPTPTTSTPASTAAPVPPTVAATTTTTVALIPQETPDLAATMLLQDWQNHDRHAALQVAVPSAVATLFAQAPQSISDRGCQNPIATQSNCAFGLGTSSLVQLQTVSLAGGWVVQTVTIPT
jgi:hypothetical protein